MAIGKVSKSAPLIGLLVRLLIWLTARLPLSLGQALGSMIGRVMAFVPNRTRQVTELNVALCMPDLSPEEHRQLVRRSLIETGVTAFEMGALWGRPPEDLAGLVTSVSGGELMDAAIESGEGVILLLPHIGNWELFNPILTRRGSFTALYRSARIDQVDRLIRRSRERTGCRMAPATSGGVRELLRALRGGGIVLILPDQEPVRAAGDWGDFFGVPALTMTLVRGLLRRTNAVALFGMALRNPDGRFSVKYSKAPNGLDDGDMQKALSSLNLGVETCIRQRPEQYQWSYKRFKSRPVGELTPYRPRSFKPANIDRLDPRIRKRLAAWAKPG